jgi:hypothetical protein
MLERFFAASDRDVDRFNAWLQHIGLGGLLVLALFAWSGYGLLSCFLYIVGHHS